MKFGWTLKAKYKSFTIQDNNASKDGAKKPNKHQMKSSVWVINAMHIGKAVMPCLNLLIH